MVGSFCLLCRTWTQQFDEDVISIVHLAYYPATAPLIQLGEESINWIFNCSCFKNQCFFFKQCKTLSVSVPQLWRFTTFRSFSFDQTERPCVMSCRSDKTRCKKFCEDSCWKSWDIFQAAKKIDSSFNSRRKHAVVHKTEL